MLVKDLLIQFFDAYLVRRSLEEALAFLSDDVISLGTGAQEIARTLCNPALTITEAAEALGFSSVSYFSRFTTRCLGMSPKAFRQSKAE